MNNTNRACFARLVLTIFFTENMNYEQDISFQSANITYFDRFIFRFPYLLCGEVRKICSAFLIVYIDVAR